MTAFLGTLIEPSPIQAFAIIGTAIALAGPALAWWAICWYLFLPPCGDDR